MGMIEKTVQRGLGHPGTSMGLCGPQSSNLTIKGCGTGAAAPGWFTRWPSHREAREGWHLTLVTCWCELRLHPLRPGGPKVAGDQAGCSLGLTEAELRSWPKGSTCVSTQDLFESCRQRGMYGGLQVCPEQLRGPRHCCRSARSSWDASRELKTTGVPGACDTQSRSLWDPPPPRETVISSVITE